MEDQWLWQNEGAIGKISSEEVSTNGFGRMILLRKGVLEGRNSSMPSIFWVKNCLHGWIYHGWTGEGEKERKPSAGVSGVLTWGGKGNDRFGDLSRADEICPENRKCWYVLPFGCGNLIRLVAIPETNSSTLKTGHPKRKFLFQPLVFRGHVSFREGRTIFFSHFPCNLASSSFVRKYFLAVAANDTNQDWKKNSTGCFHLTRGPENSLEFDTQKIPKMVFFKGTAQGLF